MEDEVRSRFFKRNDMTDLIGEIKTLILNNVVVQIKASKSNLKSIISFSPSRFNEYKKSEVIDIILKSLNEETKDCIIAKRFISGTYTEKKGYSTHYYFYKDDKETFLIKKTKNETEIYELIK